MVSSQTVNDQSQTTKLTLPCDYVKENDIIQISYDEFKTEVQQRYFSTITINNESLVTLQLRGKEKINLTLEKNKYHTGYYSTDFGSFNLDVFTNNMIFNFEDYQCYIELDYILESNKSVLSKNKILINVKELKHV